jgi:signal transduction histidine kinase
MWGRGERRQSDDCRDRAGAAAAACACLVLATVSGMANASDHVSLVDGPERNVMVLLPAESMQTWRGPFQAALQAALERTLGDVRVLSQSADVSRLGDPVYPDRLRDWLAEKYRNTAFDLIVVPDTQPLEYLDRHAPASWRSVPVVALHDADFGSLPKIAGGMTGFVVRRELRRTVEEAFALVPGATRVAVVAGAAPEERLRAASARRQLQDIPTIELVGLPMADLLPRLRALPPDAIVLFLEMCVDGAGREFLGDRAFVEVVRASARPVFGTDESLIGRGMVGGRMTDLDRAGAALGEVGARLLSGEPPAAIPFVHENFARSLYDMRELKRWGLDSRRLPLDAKLANHDESLIERYRWGVLAVIGALLLQALLIGALLVERERRRRAEGNARRSLGQLAHLDRVAAMGELATSLAHELNQPLAAILANAQAARRLLAGAEPDLHEVRASLDDIVDDDKRAGEVIRRMRTLLKKDEFRPEPVDLNEAVNEVVRLLAQDAGRRGVLVELELASDLPPVRGDTVQLQQVVLNLLVNAFEAVSRCAPERRRVRVRTREPLSGNVELTVEDAGDGIPDAHLERLFEPFFTTKSDGLGMGLSITRSILELHGGEITAQNLDGGGASFRCALPRHGRAGAPASASARAA